MEKLKIYVDVSDIQAATAALNELAAAADKAELAVSRLRGEYKLVLTDSLPASGTITLGTQTFESSAVWTGVGPAPSTAMG